MISADLGKQLEDYIQKLVDTGRYSSRNEVLREGVRLLQERETKLAALDASIARGVADAEADRIKPAGEVFDRLEAKQQVFIDVTDMPEELRKLWDQGIERLKRREREVLKIDNLYEETLAAIEAAEHGAEPQ